MKRFLRWFVDFLERKFPDKVVVTAAKYNELCAKLVAQELLYKELAEKMKALEVQMGNVNVAMGFSVPKFSTLER